MFLCGIPIRTAALYSAGMLVPLLLFASTVNPPPAPNPVAELTRGSALYRVCRAEVRLMDLPSISQASQSDLLNGSYCVGYLNGFVANLPQQSAICTNNAPMGSLVRAYVNFLDKNPDLLGEDRRLGLGMALQASFPCPSKALPSLDKPGLARVAYTPISGLVTRSGATLRR